LKGPDGGAILEYWVSLAMDPNGERLDSTAWHSHLRSDALWAQACQAAFDTK